ncbi:ribosomal RNA processing protein 36 homolog [Halyomorpha halys]|uniref:ribosomal RNA processing protein 36 homolog n=1 Tax=Halyomorpha halys TaxID=286706 RepID=UPI0006D50B56|nr:ribosomal RNA processing protein 36 homolog [Halyomorpha halys]
MDYQGRSGKKRKNKNRPEEVSSKVPPKTNFNKVRKPIDPRFDSAFGEFNEKAFKTQYGFLEKIKRREKFQLKKQLKHETDPEEVEKIQYLLTRMKNQQREKKKRDIKEKRIEEEKQKFAEAVFAGERPNFPSKKEQLAEEVLQNFEHLNSKGKLSKYLSKKHKKMSKDKKEFDQLNKSLN